VGKIAFGKGLCFQAQIEDLPLQCCILGENPKNKSTEGVLGFPGKLFPPPEFNACTYKEKKIYQSFS